MDINNGSGYSGTLAGTAPSVTIVGQGIPPFSLQQYSASQAASIAMSVSIDGVNFVPLPATNTSASSAAVIWEGPASQFQFAGSSGDTWKVL
jgi:hypothetical protein